MKNVIQAIVLYSLLLTLHGCGLAGGINQIHHPSKNRVEAGNYVVTLELGASGGNAERAFTSAQIIIDKQNPRRMDIVSASKETVIFQVEIPLDEIPHGNFSYAFRYQSDGVAYDFQPTYGMPVTVHPERPADIEDEEGADEEE